MPLYNPPATQGNSWPSLYSAPAGATAETFPRCLGSANSSGPNSGSVYLTAIGLPSGLVVSNLTMITGSNAKTGGTHGWYVLTDNNLVVRAVTADQTDAATVWGATTTAYTLAFASPYTTTYNGLYYVGFMVAESAGTMPNFVAVPSISAAGIYNSTPVLTGISSTGQTTPPTAGSTTLTAITGGGARLCYAYTS